MLSGDDLEAALADMLATGASPSDAARRAEKRARARAKKAAHAAPRLAGKL